MKKRVFLACLLSLSLQEKIEAWQKKYGDLPVRWIAKKNLHLTLIPPWYEANLEGLITRIQKEPLSINPFALKIEQVEFGPNPKKPRLIWTKGETPQELVKVKRTLELKLNKTPEKRKFSPHITLARFSLEQWKAFNSKKLNEKVAWREKINSFCLMESVLKKTGADYREIIKVRFLLPLLA